jgi:hypothetical protein
MVDNVTKSKFERKEVTKLATFAIVMIPLSTYLLATKESPLYYSLSMIGNESGHRMEFILWGIMTGLFLTFFIERLYALKSFENPRARKLLIASLIFLLLTVLIPYMKDLKILSKIHNIMAAAFGFSLTASLYLFIKYLSERDQKLYHWSMIMLCIIIGGSLGLFFIFGRTGIFELFFFFSLSIFLGILNKELFRKKKKR